MISEQIICVPSSLAPTSPRITEKDAILSQKDCATYSQGR